MLRDFRLLRRNSEKNQDVEEIENVPINPNESSSNLTSSDSSMKPKLSIEQGVSGKTKFDKTPTKPRGKSSDTQTLPLRTPERQGNGNGNVGRNRFGFSSMNECRDEGRPEMANYLNQPGRNGSFSVNSTPRVNGTSGRANSGYSDTNSTQTTPTKSVSKPPNPGFASLSSSRHPGNGSARGGTYAAFSRGFPVSNGQLHVNTVEVPHFDLKEDPSFWMDHNVQVILRVRPLNSTEKSTNGHNRCVRQDSAQSITWIGQPETRFTFDHVACESVDQEMLFRMAGLPMVENCLSGYNSCMFAYGQTGSGKTYTMLGEMEDLEFKPSPHRGMTPRIFEFLFARIRAEEESRMDEKLKYNCKCSFLEIYNEQITDLLDPTSTNLLLREDVMKGVYVENLSEFEVHTVGDVLRLLIQGSSNRKVAATNMNRESSRSHSVFTCVIESKWERDSTNNLRFARLNLVDLAGSERQKSSGAEGERLKEAANINKSLSTLGHVIMLLVDIAHGKQRHVPYRDSRLTFLLQDSLGGNSKTTIIANISPSICCAAETLNTLKFAQRAKLIQNNAVVNEDSSGDVAALRHQILILKEELSALKRQNVSRTLAFDPSSIENRSENDQPNSDDFLGSESKGSLRVAPKQLKSLETMLAGALRREQMAENSIKQLEAEIEQLNRLVRQREEDTRCSKMMMKFREDKIHRMESLLGGLKPVDDYLLEENAALIEETQLLRAKVDRNPEVTRFALENIRLLEQLRRFQDFYEEGERDILMDELSELRAQLICFLDNSNQLHNHANIAQDVRNNFEETESLRFELTNTQNEMAKCQSKLKCCLDNNEKLSREIENLQALLRSEEPKMYGQCNATKEIEVPHLGAQAFDAVQEDKYKSMHGNVIVHAEDIVNLELELDILKIILKEERLSRGKIEEMASSLTKDAKLAEERLLLISKKLEDAKSDLKEAKCVIEALESQQLLSINEIEDLKNSNSHYLLKISALKEQAVGKESNHSFFKHSKCENSPLQLQLKRMQASLDKAKRLNMWYQSDHASNRSNEEEMDEIRRQAEAETAEVIVCLQEELSGLQQRVHESDSREREAQNRLLILENKLKEKDTEIKSLTEDWEKLSCEIEEVLVEGHEALRSASNELDSISSPFSNKRGQISEQLGKIIRQISDKESIIEELNRYLEDANARTIDMEHMLMSLRGATMVMTESHQQECYEKEKEILELRMELSRKISAIEELENSMKLGSDQMRKTSSCAIAAFVIVNRLSEINSSHLVTLKRKEILLGDQATEFEQAQRQIEALGKELEVSEDNCTKLKLKLDEQLREISTMQRRLEESHNYAIAKTKETLNDLKMGVSNVRSSMNEYVERVGYCEEEHNPNILSVDGVNGEKTGDETKQQTSRGEKDITVSYNNLESMKSYSDNGRKDATILLLRKEIESAMESLKEVQVEMARLRAEKEEICMSKKKCRDSAEIVRAGVLSLQGVFDDFEKQCESKILALNHKLDKVEECANEAKSSWCQTKELIELELGDANATAAQKTLEASCLHAMFEESQDTMKEADIMINNLMIANETMKLEIEDLRNTRTMLIGERDNFINEVQELRSSNDLKDQKFKNLEDQFELDVSKTMSLVEELEGLVSMVHNTSEEAFMSLSNDFNCIKSQVQDTMKLMHSSLEEIWSEILMKDCALSVLHLCHMGILLEAVHGLNAENGLLHRGICESNAIMSDLREHNMKSKEELEICRVLKEKLLTDIKNNFDCISSREGETRELNTKLSSFKEKLEILQHQEELMLERSNLMGSQLSLLMEELDQSNSIVMSSLSEQEKLIKSNEEVIKTQAENFLLELYAKDFELLVLASEVENVQNDMFLVESSSRDHHHKLLTMEEENEALQKKLHGLKRENCTLIKDFQEKDSEVKSYLGCIHMLKSQNHSLQEMISTLESRVALLEKDMGMKNDVLDGFYCSQSSTVEALCKKIEDLENHAVKDELCTVEQGDIQALGRSGFKVAKCVSSMEIIDLQSHKMLKKLDEKIIMLQDQMSEETCQNLDIIPSFLKELEVIDSIAKGLVSENMSLQEELLRKDEILNGLLFDLRLLQESAANSKDQKDEIEELVATLENTEDELAIKSHELDEAVAYGKTLKAKVKDLEKANQSLELMCDENMVLRSHMEEIEAERSLVERELIEKRGIIDNLENEIIEMGNTISQMNDLVESLKNNLNEVSCERDHLREELVLLEEKVDTANALAEEHEAIAVESQEIAESRRIYAEEKEEEVKLLERSVQELDSTISVLENKVDILKGEAERQRLQREELELELHSLKNQMHNVESVDSNIKRNLDEKARNLQEALKCIKILEKELAHKDTEIAQCKAHISELSLHAEAQACEYKHKFKELEAMVEQVKAEEVSSHDRISSSNKLEKNASKGRGSSSPFKAKGSGSPFKAKGSGSPFKCIGLGLAHQLKSEKDEELNAERLRIEELEALLASRQKEIFLLNSRLATAESMTHDVIRDLLGVKLDMNNYATFFNEPHVQKITEKAQLSPESQDEEVKKLKKQLNEFIEERQCWLEEIDRRQAELVAAQIALEKHRQQEQLLTAENDVLKMEIGNHKKRVMELEREAKKLSGQQNLQQRIHHHAKIKEENNVLKTQIEDLSSRLRHTESFLSRTKEELAHYRACNGKKPYINFDAEQRLNSKLKETEKEKLQLAQALLGLCTNILKAAGITKPTSEINLSAAEEALGQLGSRVISLERALEDLKLKNKIAGERIRLVELMPNSSPFSSRSEDNHQTPRRATQTPFFSELDR